MLYWFCFSLQSAYPPRLSWGFPKYHHLILYVLVISRESQEQLQVGLIVGEDRTYDLVVTVIRKQGEIIKQQAALPLVCLLSTCGLFT